MARRKCRVCGCTDDKACPGGCSWVQGEEGSLPLCTSCFRRRDVIASAIFANMLVSQDNLPGAEFDAIIQAERFIDALKKWDQHATTLKLRQELRWKGRK